MQDPYIPLSRRYRPKRFADVVGQEAAVKTLLYALQHERVGQAYLFSGSRGTGKTTLARLLAKALNCSQPDPGGEPCNRCPSCKDILSGNSLDVVEIDGASHRGIDDIRQLNETVGYTTVSGGYKVYIIDEVHMLTKEAFNALLKTLEEPPPKVLFVLATTEPHKVPATVISRCQRFQLQRIPTPDIIAKLSAIVQELEATVSSEAIQIIADLAEGGLRDAESLLDQVLSFHGLNVSAHEVAEVLGLMPSDTLFRLDTAVAQGSLLEGFAIADFLFSSGKNLGHFLESLVTHYRHLLYLVLDPANSTLLELPPNLVDHYLANAAIYDRAQCLTILDDLVATAARMKDSPSQRVELEMLLSRIIRSKHRLSLEAVAERLSLMEQRLKGAAPSAAPPTALPPREVAPTPSQPAVSKPPAASVRSPSPVQGATTKPPLMDPATAIQFAAAELEGTLEIVDSRLLSSDN